jgi:hypothetical protein
MAQIGVQRLEVDFEPLTEPDDQLPAQPAREPSAAPVRQRVHQPAPAAAPA